MHGNTADYAAAVVDYADASVFVADYSEVDAAFVVPSHPTMNRIAIYSRLEEIWKFKWILNDLEIIAV